MKQKIQESIVVPEGITCKFENNVLECTKDSLTISRNMSIPNVDISANNTEIKFVCEKGSKNERKKIMTYLAHIENIFRGLDSPFEYKLEAANVHFPMTLKLEGDKLVVSNFLGEKTNRIAKILPNVKIDVKGQNITLSSHDREAAGQTAANIEKATKVTGRDRRIFQDGIYITAKPERRSE